MAKFKSLFDFSGKNGKYSIYKRKDSDEIILRRSGGPTKQQINSLPQFERTRQNNSEFAACSMFTAGIRAAMYPVNHLGDSGFTSALTSLAKKIQVLDEMGERGERNIRLSRFRHMLDGFNLNLECPFDGVFRAPVVVKTNRKNATASIIIPKAVPGVNLHLPWKTPYYRFIFSLGPISDVLFKDNAFDCKDAGATHFSFAEWQHAEASAEETVIDMQLEKSSSRTVSYVLAIGIEPGVPDRFGEKEPKTGAGTAKILTVF
ncbi:hypothetical protein [Chitinophaga sp.]|uniref:hypothetical protein n=1 Tax=Chitinophaga sp. TaxID=1869181 RepID=UPI0031DF8C3F